MQKERFQLFKSGMGEEEINQILKKLGPNFENVSYTLTKYSGGLSSEEVLRQLIHEAEADSTNQEFIIKQTEFLCNQILEKINQIDLIKKEISENLNESEISKLKNKLNEAEAEFKNLLHRSPFAEEIIDNN